MSEPSSDAPDMEQSILPIVASPSAGPSRVVIIVGMAIAAILLFVALDGRRRALEAPVTIPRQSDLLKSDALPPLAVPPMLSAPLPYYSEASRIERPVVIPPAPVRVVEVRPPPPPVMQPQYPPFQPTPPPPPARTSGGVAVVYDISQGATSGAGTSDPGQGARGGGLDTNGAAIRSRAGRLADRSSTVPQGTLIPAVLETAINSSGGGLVRALVQRDVSGFDGRRVLIPRGSRLIGEYGSDASQSQHRLLINWVRLVRPDGATMALGSPAADAVGAAGVKASVNSHFLSRFADALLQTAMNVGAGLATRSYSNTVVLGGSTSIGSIASNSTPSKSTLSVKQGASVSVFVARDLDFSDVDSAP